MFQARIDGPFTVGAIVLDIIYYPLLVWGIWAAIKEYNKTKHQRISKISVDKNGIHYHFRNGKVDNILYKDLQKSKEAYVQDIDYSPGAKYAPSYIFGFVNGKRKNINFYAHVNGVDYLIKNKNELRAHFLLGVRLFNNRINVSPSIYPFYYINPETFEFDKKAYRNTVIFSVILIVIIATIIYIWLWRDNRHD